MTVVVVDDHLLLRVLLGREPESLRPAGAAVVTTGLWYHRLCRALADQTVVGALSSQLGRVQPDVAERAVHAVVDLPEAIALVSLRALAWPMARLLADGVRLNLLSFEALAAAEHLDAEICLATADDNAPLRAAAKLRRVPLRRIRL